MAITDPIYKINNQEVIDPNAESVNTPGPTPIKDDRFIEFKNGSIVYEDEYLKKYAGTERYPATFDDYAKRFKTTPKTRLPDAEATVSPSEGLDTVANEFIDVIRGKKKDSYYNAFVKGGGENNLFKQDAEEGQKFLNKLFEGSGLETNVVTTPVSDRGGNLWQQPTSKVSVSVGDESIELDFGTKDITDIQNNLEGLNALISKNESVIDMPSWRKQKDVTEENFAKNKAIQASIEAEREIAKLEFSSPDLFTPYKEEIPRVVTGFDTANYNKITKTVIPYEKELTEAKKSILKQSPGMSPAMLTTASENVVRKMLYDAKVVDELDKANQNAVSSGLIKQEDLAVASSIIKNKEAEKWNEGNRKLAFYTKSNEDLLRLEEYVTASLDGKGPAENEEEISKLLNNTGIEYDAANTKHYHGKTVGKGIWDLYQDIQLSKEAVGLNYSNQFKEQEDTTNRIDDLDVAMQASALNYNLAEKYGSSVGVGFATIATGIGRLAGEIVTLGQTDILRELGADYSKWAEEEKNSFVRDVSLEDSFSSPVNFGKFWIQEVSVQLPIFAAMAASGGTAAPFIIGASTAGSKMNDMNAEIARGTANYSDMQIWSRSLGYGLLEGGLSTVSSIKILKNSKARWINSGKNAESVLDNATWAYIGKETSGFAAESLVDVSSEVVTAIGQNILDGNNPTDGIVHAGYSALGFNLLLGGTPYLRGVYNAQFSDFKSRKEALAIQAEINRLGAEYKNIDGRTVGGKLIKESIETKSIELADAISKQDKLISNKVSETGATYILDGIKQQIKIQAKAKEIVDSDLSESEKKIQLDALQAIFDEVTRIKNNALSTETLQKNELEFKAFELMDKAKYDEYLSNAESELMDERDGKAPTDNDIDRRAFNLYFTDKVVEENSKQATKDGVFDGNFKSFNTVEEALAHLETTELGQSTEDWAIKAKEVITKNISKQTNGSAGADGFAMPGEDGVAGKITIAIVENQVASQRKNTRTHEVGHQAAWSILSKAANKDVLAEISTQLLATLKNLDQKVHDSFLKENIREKDGSFDPDEVVAKFLEYIADGKITSKEKAKGIAGLFGVMVQKEFGKDFDFDFKGEEDIFNFVVGLGNKIKNNSLTVADLKNISEGAIITKIADKVEREVTDTTDNTLLEAEDKPAFSLNVKQDLKWKQTDEALETKFKVGDRDFKMTLEETAFMEFDEGQTYQDISDIAKELGITEDKDGDEIESSERYFHYEFGDAELGKDVTGTGNALEVFSVAGNGLVDLLNKKKKIEGVIFTAKEPSRIRLYKRLGQTLADEIGGSFGYKNDTFIISKKSPVKGEVKFSKSTPLEAINALVPNTVKTQEEYFSPKVFNPIYKATENNGVISNYIKSKSPSKEVAERTITSIQERLVNYDPAAERKKAGNKQPITFGEFIFANTNFGKLDAKKALFKESEAAKKTTDLDTKEAQGKIAEEDAVKKDRPKFRKLIDSSVLPGFTINEISGKLTKVLKVLKSKLDAKVSINKSVSPLIAEIKQAMGKQADIDLKEAMGGKADAKLQKWLLKNKKAILENMTTTWLMSAIPQAIQKSVGGTYKVDENGTRVKDAYGDFTFVPNFTSDWQGKTVDREKTSTNKLGKTAGGDIVRRLPNIATALSDADFVGSVLEGVSVDGDGNMTSGAPIRGRKESMAKAIAEEISLEVFNRELQNEDSEISKAFENNQEALGVVLADTFIKDIARQIERGQVKFSENIFIKNQDFVKVYTEFAAENKQWNAAVKSFKLEPLNMKTEAGRALYRGWIIGVLPKYLPKSFFENNGTFTGTTKSIKDEQNNEIGRDYAGNFAFLKNKDLKETLDKIDNYAEDSESIAAAVKKQSYANIAEKLNDSDFNKFQDLKIDGLRDIFLALEKMMKDNPANIPFVAAMLSSTSAYQGHFMRVAAPIRFYTTGIDGAFVEEHTLPASLTAKYLFKLAIEGKVSENFDNVKKNYFQGALAKSYDNMLKGTKPDGKPFNYKETPPEGWNLTDDIWARYFNPNVATNSNGISPYNIILAGGVSIAKKFNINSSGHKVPKAIASVDYAELNTIETEQKAINNARSIKWSQSPKKIRVFDFDDTLARTKSNVLYTMPDGTKGKIDAATFAKEAANMEAEGAVWDFSEFSKVMQGSAGPLLEVAKIIADKRGTKDVFVLTARPADAAGPIQEFLASMGLNIPIENITGLGNGTPKAKADWVVAKVADGYNDFYFADDHTGNVKAVKEALNTFDVKGKVQLAKIKFSKSLDAGFNEMIARNKGVAAQAEFSRVVAKRRGAGIGKFKVWMPSSLDDFKGLTSYTFAGKGRQGDADQKFFQDALITPYFRGVAAIETAKQTLSNDFRELNKAFKPVLKKLGKIAGDTGYTNDQAIRVYLWNKAGYEVPGLSKRDSKKLNDLIANDPELSAYAEAALLISKKDKWIKPSAFWDAETILSDLNNFTEKTNRKEFIAEFIENADIIFSEKNLNKIEATYGTRQREALEDILYRMKTGTNRTSGMNKAENTWNNWVNNSIGAIMFFNRRSALLQTLSTVNFINWSDNNPAKAALAFANQPQYWKDFSMLFNSDKLKQRRSGLKSDVNEAEIASAVKGAKNKATAALSYLLKIGFTPTQIADSFAIAAGGATFYRNRVNSLVKNGMSKTEAETKAFEDFSQISEETQQSGDPALISSDQASTLGRLVLAFQNTPIQLNRSIKKAGLDIYNRRRTPGYTQLQSDFSNVSKMVYYGAVQSAIFTALQSALFALIPGFDDEEYEDEQIKEKKDAATFRMLSSIIDTTLKGGFGLPGAVVSTIKNIVIEYNKQEEKGYTADHTYTILQTANLSPPIGSKLGKLYKGIQTKKFDAPIIAKRGWDVTIDGRFNLSPQYSVLGSVVEASINLPVGRVVDELNSMTEALDSRNTVWQQIALGLGWKSWNVGAANEEHDLIKTEAKAVKKIENAAKAKTKRAEKKAKKETERVALLTPYQKQVEAYDKYLKEQKAAKSKAKKMDNSINKLSTARKNKK